MSQSTDAEIRISRQSVSDATEAMVVSAPVQTSESYEILKERHLVAQLAQQLAEAQFAHADESRSRRLWDEVAALDIDPDRVLHLLYGGNDLDDEAALCAEDRSFTAQPRRRRQQGRRWLKGAWPLKAQPTHI